MPSTHHAPNFIHIHYFLMVGTEQINPQKAYILPNFPLILNQVSSLINMNSLQRWCLKFVNWNLFLSKVNSRICSYLSCKTKYYNY